MKVLITGSNGLLGQKLVALFLKRKVDFLATSKGKNRNQDCPNENYREMDITSLTQVREVFEKYAPSHVIHTAAMTNVDACELDPESCELMNVTGTQYLFETARALNAHFQLLSTDFIFDGEKGNYVETDLPNPLGVYSRSKLNAENLVMNSGYDNYSIVRTIIVYGMGNNLSRSNIVLWAKSALEKGETINIVDDQFRAPTYAEDLAIACAEILNRNEKGVFHICGPETMSIYDLVIRIGNYFFYDTSIVNRISSNTLNQPAARPPRTGFNLAKAQKYISYKPHTIEESLSEIYEQGLASIH